MEKVLITGGSGLIGSRLTSLLLKEKYEVAWLVRKRYDVEQVKQFSWNPDNNFLEKEAMLWPDYIIHLAGATISKRWTNRYKTKILESRIQTLALMKDNLESSQLKTFISSSAIGYYGAFAGNELKDESASPGSGYLADVVVRWEEEADALTQKAERMVKLRTGIVLSGQGGALSKMATPVKMGVGAPLGSGLQMMSWIHIDDLCRMFLHVLKNGITGVFNAVAPNPETNKSFTKKLAAALHRPLIAPPVPSWFLRMLLGEMSDIVLGGANASSGRIETTGFHFRFTHLEEALEDIYK